MSTLEELLSPEHLEMFCEAMQVQSAAGDSIAAEQCAFDMLRILATDKGHLDERVAARIGGTANVGVGRSTIIPLIVAALIGPEPHPEVWLEAVGKGGWKPLTYGSEDSKTGSPGVFLQRMVANCRKLSNHVSTPALVNQLHRTELGLLTACVLVRELHTAVAARSGLGPAWVVWKATDRLTQAEQSRLDGLSGNHEFICELGAALSEVIRHYEGAPAQERTHTSVKISLPAGTDVTGFFADRAAAKAEMRGEILDEVLRQIELDTVTGVNEILSDSEQHRIKDVLEQRAYESYAISAENATAYLQFDWAEMPKQERFEHLARLAFMMPSLAEGARAEDAFRGLVLGQPYANFVSTGDRASDFIFKDVLQRIMQYAREVGPPPPTTPLLHYPFFEAAAWCCAQELDGPWDAKLAWGNLALTTQSVPQFSLQDAIKAVGKYGIKAINVTSHD